MSMPTPDSLTKPIVRSTDEIRSRIVNELARSLNVDAATIDPAAPLETLGIDSLAAIGLTGELAEWIGRDIPATLMWDYASINAIAEGLAAQYKPAVKPKRPGVVDLQPNGDRRPLFCFPGLGGHPVTFTALATHLGPQQPCYGLVVPGLDGKQKPLTSVEDITSAMLVNLRLVQPNGPYQLAGYSFGGLLAYEAARQLTVAGETVSMLAIYDTFTPGGRVSRPAWQRLGLHAYLLATRRDRIAYLREKVTRRTTVARGIPVHGVKSPPDPNANTREANIKRVLWVNNLAIANYQPKPYPGAVILFRAIDRPIYNVFYRTDPSNGWGALAGAGVRVFDLPGDHMSLLQPEHAKAAADLLTPHLAHGEIRK